MFTKKLRDGEMVEVEGALFVMDGDGLVTDVGDWYIAQRNVGPQLLTVREFCYYDGKNVEKRRTCARDERPSWINPVEVAYAYNYGECVKVKWLD